jgi:hypothetical protein
MNKLLKLLKIVLPTAMLIMCVSCSKEPGEGGNATITGKVWVKDYNSTFTILQEEYYAQDEDVYIVFGDDVSYGDHVKTLYNGSFEFKYLRKGDYHVYVYSKDSTNTTNAMIPVIRNVTIDKRNETVEVPMIVIIK